MLQSLLIKNYALIDEVTIQFSHQLSIITGETGAGKSIMLGAVQLLLGGRADKNLLADTSVKCLVEAIFDTYSDRVSHILKDNELDEDEENLIIRREIAPSGKSRAFVNDTPVTLAVIKQLASELIDLNRQHELLEVQKLQFHYELIDSIALAPGEYSAYHQTYRKYQKLLKSVEVLKEQLSTLTRERNYILFQLNEVEELNLQPGEYKELEGNILKLEQSQEISSLLQATQEVLINSEVSVSDTLRQLRNRWEMLGNIDSTYKSIADRLASLGEEIIDITSEVSGIDGTIHPESSLEDLMQRRDVIASLLLKHGVNNAEELDAVIENWQESLSKSDNLQSDIDQYQKDIRKLETQLANSAKTISSKRIKSFKQLEDSINVMLTSLNMEHANIQVKHTSEETFSKYGIDNLEIVFSSNKGSDYRSIKDIASGGEMSRLMLCMKTVGAESLKLPTLVFDEIDAGVSGAVAHKMGAMLKTIADKHQVIVITHSPQVTSMADLHLEVYKDNTGERAISGVKVLANEERVIAIAKMLSGENPTAIAIKNAKELVNSKL